MSHLTQNRPFRRHSSQPISWLGTEETKPNSKHNKSKQHRHKIISANKKTRKILNLNNHIQKKSKPKPTCKIKNCSCVHVYRCAQLSYTTQHRKVLIIFPPNLQSRQSSQLRCLSVGGEEAAINYTHPTNFSMLQLTTVKCQVCYKCYCGRNLQLGR